MAFLTDTDAEFVRRRLTQEMVNDVRLVFFAPSAGGLTLPGEDAQAVEYTRQILKEMVGLSGRLTLEEHSMISEPDLAKQMNIERVPATAVIGLEDYGVRYFGIPGGYEFVTLLELILDVSKAAPPLSPDTLAAMAGLQGDVHLQVFVTPT